MSTSEFHERTDNRLFAKSSRTVQMNTRTLCIATFTVSTDEMNTSYVRVASWLNTLRLCATLRILPWSTKKTVIGGPERSDPRNKDAWRAEEQLTTLPVCLKPLPVSQRLPWIRPDVLHRSLRFLKITGSDASYSSSESNARSAQSAKRSNDPPKLHQAEQPEQSRKTTMKTTAAGCRSMSFFSPGHQTHRAKKDEQPLQTPT